MKQLNLIVIFCVAIITPVDAQVLHQRAFLNINPYTPLDVTWSQSDQTYVLTTVDGNGNLNVGKTDPTGYPLWNKAYNLGDSIVYYSISTAVAPNGNMYFSGSHSGDTSSSSYVHYFIMATDPWGTVLWTKLYQTPSMWMYDRSQLRLLSDGSLLITESVYGSIAYIKTDSYGNVIQSHQYREDTTAENKTPGFDSDVFPDGSMIFTGKRGSDIMVVRTDASGQMMWSSLWNQGFGYYHAKSVQALSDGTSLVAGSDNSRPFLMRVDALGSMMWYEVMAATSGTFYDIEAINDSIFVVAGDASGKPVITKFDINGNIISTITAGDSNVYFGSQRVDVNPAGQIAWPGVFSNNVTAIYGGGLMIMNGLAWNGCMMDTMNLVPSTTSQDPSIVAVPIYGLEQSIAVTTLNITGQLAPLTYSDLCPLVNVEETPPAHTGMSMQNTLVEAEKPLSFSLDAYSGDVSFVITDMTGRVVQTGSAYSTAGQSIPVNDTRHLASGMYVLNVTAGSASFAEKFVVR